MATVHPREVVAKSRGRVIVAGVIRHDVDPVHADGAHLVVLPLFQAVARVSIVYYTFNTGVELLQSTITSFCFIHHIWAKTRFGGPTMF